MPTAAQDPPARTLPAPQRPSTMEQNPMLDLSMVVSDACDEVLAYFRERSDLCRKCEESIEQLEKHYDDYCAEIFAILERFN